MSILKAIAETMVTWYIIADAVTPIVKIVLTVIQS